MISNSFHSSAKSHSISSVGSLAKAERHNSRGYFSFYYDKSKISDLVGTADSLAADVENAINQTFAENVFAYNEKQKRADRKIQTSAFEHFAENKKLDLAVESILQIGDKEFWGQFRDDRIVTRNGRELVLKSFPEEVKRVMDDIFKKQISAYENIYQTHGEIIAAKICTAYDEAAAVAAKSEQEHPDFKEIYKVASKERVSKIKELSPEDQTAFAEYSEARDTMAVIVNSKLRERISDNHMHIKVVGATAHYDEFSPHAHSISLCYADGYSKGLSSRVAKSVVLNRWALEVIQDRMHEIAEQEMKRHPEIFQGEDLKEKEQGRNFDYTTEQITRQNLAKLTENASEARREAHEASQEALRAANELRIVQNRLRVAKEQEDALEGKYVALQLQTAEAERELEDLTERVELIQTFEEYTERADEIEEKASTIERLLERLKDAVRLFKQKEAQEFIDDFKNAIGGIFEWIRAHFGRVKEYEIYTDMEEEQRRSPSLAEKIKSAEAKVDRSTQNIEKEYLK